MTTLVMKGPLQLMRQLDYQQSFEQMRKLSETMNLRLNTLTKLATLYLMIVFVKMKMLPLQEELLIELNYLM